MAAADHSKIHQSRFHQKAQTLLWDPELLSPHQNKCRLSFFPVHVSVYSCSPIVLGTWAWSLKFIWRTIGICLEPGVEQHNHPSGRGSRWCTSGGMDFVFARPSVLRAVTNLINSNCHFWKLWSVVCRLGSNLIWTPHISLRMVYLLSSMHPFCLPIKYTV